MDRLAMPGTAASSPATSPTSTTGDATIVWAPGAAWSRLTVVAFRRVVDCAAVPGEAWLELFAHSHYRLHVNGTPVASGPARSGVDAPAYDHVDLLPFLRPGRNVLAVLVAHCGEFNYHHQSAPGGFLAWGRVGAVDLATPGGWRCQVSAGHAADAPRWSFAVPIVEICDERAWPVGWDGQADPAGAWTAPTAVAHAPWGDLQPCGIPQLTQDVRRPVRISRAYLHATGERIHGFRLVQDHDLTAGGFPKETALASTWIHTPTARMVTMGIWWGEHGLNGAALEQAAERAGSPMRRDCSLALKAGWNLLVISYGMTFGSWECQVALPDDLTLDATRGESGGIAFRSAGPFPAEALARRWTGFPVDAGGLLTLADSWRDHPSTPVPVSPQRHLAWARPGEAIDVDQGAPFPLGIPAGRDGSVVCDFGRIVLGRVHLRLRAPAGTVVDLAYAEEEREGRPFYHRSVVTCAADRRIVGASADMTTFFRRGFRFLEVGIAGHDRSVTIEAIEAVEERYPFDHEGTFACSEPRLTTLWDFCRETLRNCAEDVFTDCPWRERTLYGGDLFVETAVNTVVSRDLRLVRRSLEVYLGSPNRDGGVGGRAPSVPAANAAGAEEFQLMVLRTACWYHRLSRDDAALRSWLPRLRAILAVFAQRDPATLCFAWHRSFIDHGSPTAREGLICAPNAVLAGALLAFADLLDALGEDGAETRRDGQAVAAALRRHFWDAKAGAFRSYLGPAREGIESHHLHDAAHMGCWGLTDADQDRVLAETYARRLEDLADDPAQRSADHQGRSDDRCSAYGSFYLLVHLARLAAAATAERFIGRFYADMLEHPSGTIWEHFHTGGSLNHAWAAGPAWYLSTQVLGVQLGPDSATPLDRVVIAPCAEEISWAEGTVPHPLGPVQVRWEVRGEILHLRHRTPVGARVVVTPRGRLANLRLVVDAQE